MLAPFDSSGDGPSAPVRLEFHAPAGCPTESEFVRQLEARNIHLHEPSGTAAARVLRARVETSPAGATGRLLVVEPDGSTFERTVEAADCDEATTALAVIATLVLQPRAPRDPVPAASTRPESTITPSSPSSTPPLPLPTPAPPSSTPPPTAPPPSTPSPSPAPLSARRPAEESAGGRAWSFDVHATAFSTLGMAPEPTVGGALFVGAAVSPQAWTLAPSVDVGIAGTFDGTYVGANGNATLGFTTGVVDACLLLLRPVASLSLRPCVSGEYGIIRAIGSNTDNARSANRPWAAAGPEARLSLIVAGPFSVDAAVGALVAIDRDRFVIGSETIFEIPPIVGRGLLGVGYTTP
jgi:hypothetical protein